MIHSTNCPCVMCLLNYSFTPAPTGEPSVPGPSGVQSPKGPPARRLIGYRVTWRKHLPSGEREPRQILYTGEHARSYARCAADVLRGVGGISDVRVWRVYRRCAEGGQ